MYWNELACTCLYDKRECETTGEVCEWPNTFDPYQPEGECYCSPDTGFPPQGVDVIDSSGNYIYLDVTQEMVSTSKTHGIW